MIDEEIFYSLQVKRHDKQRKWYIRVASQVAEQIKT